MPVLLVVSMFTVKTYFMEPSRWLVTYQRPDKSFGQEMTTNVPLTVSMLQAQGFIIIVIEGG